MPYRPHTLIAFGGTLSETDGVTQDEIWENTLRVYSPGGSLLPLSDPAGYMGEIATPLATWFASSANGMANTARLSWLKVNNIGADGNYTGAATNVHDYDAPVAGGANPTMPSYMSVCLSWTTAVKRGAAWTGRIYPPNYCYTFQGAAVTSSGVSALVQTAKDLLTLVRNIDGDLGAIPIVASNIGATTHEIQGVRVGNIVDVQRRRRDAVKETYQAASWDSADPS